MESCLNQQIAEGMQVFGIRGNQVLFHEISPSRDRIGRICSQTVLFHENGEIRSLHAHLSGCPGNIALRRDKGFL
jgi:hypothetical protein